MQARGCLWSRVISLVMGLRVLGLGRTYACGLSPIPWGNTRWCMGTLEGVGWAVRARAARLWIPLTNPSLRRKLLGGMRRPTVH